MLFFNIFNSFGRISLIVFLFAVLFWSLWLVRISKDVRGFVCFSAALLCMLATSFWQNFSDLFSIWAVSIKILTFAEMLFVLGSFVLLVMGASWLLFQKDMAAPFIFSFITVGLGLVIYSLFVSGDANVLINIRQLLPVIGMGSFFLSLVAQPQFFRRGAYVVLSLSCLSLIGLMVWPMLRIEIYPWYLPPVCVGAAAAALFWLYVDDLKKSLSRMSEKYCSAAQNIENIVRMSPFPIIISRLSDDALILANRNAAKLFGINVNELSRYHFKDFFIDADNRKLFLERLEKKQEIQDFEILVKSSAGNMPFWLLVSANAMDYNNDVVLYTAFQDITDRKRREDLLRSQADRDPLTSIYNRRYFEVHAAEKIMSARRSKAPFAILMLDADHFKKVNDSYGHKIGDKVLIELASVCERTLRADDLVARYGGEEFIIFLENVDAQTAFLVAGRLREAINSSIVYSDKNDPIHFSVSIGVAPSGISDNVDAMIKMADDAMYLAKLNGRNRVEIFDQEKIEQAKLPKVRETDQKNQRHPVYFDEDEQEISLLDGAESKRIIED